MVRVGIYIDKIGKRFEVCMGITRLRRSIRILFSKGKESINTEFYWPVQSLIVMI